MVDKHVDKKQNSGTKEKSSDNHRGDSSCPQDLLTEHLSNVNTAAIGQYGRQRSLRSSPENPKARVSSTIIVKKGMTSYVAESWASWSEKAMRAFQRKRQ